MLRWLARSESGTTAGSDVVAITIGAIAAVATVAALIAVLWLIVRWVEED